MMIERLVSPVPCPFCGTATDIVVDVPGPGVWHVGCEGCAAAGPVVTSGPADAIEAWTTRPTVSGGKGGDLLACPFCGQRDVHTLDAECPGGFAFVVHCQTCDCIGPPGPQPRTAVARWNRRARRARRGRLALN